MNNDLISRKALKKALYDFLSENSTTCDREDIFTVIDNAPTVETYTIEDIQTVREDALILGAKLAQRPEGEWINESISFGCGDAECSKCHKKAELIVKDNGWGYDYFSYNFCPNCGAKMRIGGAK